MLALNIAGSTCLHLLQDLQTHGNAVVNDMLMEGSFNNVVSRA